MDEGQASAAAEATADAVTTGRGRGAVSLIMLGVVLLLLGGAIGWAEDAAAPYWNEGEADLPETVEFEASAGTYVVITSGPSRPLLEQTGCTITTADGKTVTDRGSEGVEGGRTRVGVTRVLEFEAVDGPTTVTCGYSFNPEGGNGRFQVVAADTPVHLASLGLLLGGLALLIGGICWLVAVLVRRPSSAGA